jgi:hypothetical protein
VEDPDRAGHYCLLTCFVGRSSKSKGAVLYIGDAQGRCHFYSHTRGNFYQDPLVLFPHSKTPNKKTISQLLLIKYSRENFFLVAAEGFLKRKIAILNEFTNQLKHFKFADRICKLGVLRDPYSAVRESPPPDLIASNGGAGANDKQVNSSPG